MMSVEMCNACDKMVDLDYDVEGAWNKDNKYFCFPCIDKYGMVIEDGTDEIINMGDYE